ncbi:hypothetical protein [Sporolactobacillus laevolacticus]|uniref:Aminoglycoside phosphotransferase domain-containing protein n=1 Tax=Sporolactobacillus laevolacticus DSM 442 TaxID=1395513 RepID=V6J850_9BACL|nr:hypothetical protein [Sporolactobacillus laevolacticus]EST12964.1 hypothetical protein P343_04180 [Sporolactobacillus laevolacticus DSM 442]
MNMPDWQSLVENAYDLQIMDEPVSLFFQPINRFYHQNLDLLAQWADYLNVEKGLPICRLLRNREGQFGTEINGESWVLMSREQMRRDQGITTGMMLAELHLQSSGIDVRAFPESPANSRTKDWEDRMDALERKYEECLSRKSQSAFEQIFLNNFPYFSGCAENAIQMNVDGFIDFPNQDPVCIGHYRYSNDDHVVDENPALWVVDDRSRDLAEGLRVLVWRTAKSYHEPDVFKFLDDYESRYPLTEHVIYNMYGRLLYPLAFVECCERYFFSSNSTDQRELELLLRHCEEKAEDNEQLLSLLAQRYDGQLQVPEWLIKQ